MPHPLHPALVAFPIACFAGTLATDLTYAFTADMQWANMSAWLLTAGLVTSVAVVAAGLVDFVRTPGVGGLPVAWAHGLGNLLAIGLSVLNLLVHSRDGYTSVVPLGLTLSVLVTLILAATGWLGREMVFRHGVGRPGGVRS